jgi:hypothetical protein
MIRSLDPPLTSVESWRRQHAQQDDLEELGMSWYYCLVHKAVEPEAGCANAERMGPYATEAEAGAALEKAHDRNEAFDADED